MKTALLIGRNASGKSNFGSALFDITFGFPEAFDYSDLDDRLFLNADCGRGTAQFTYVFEFDGHEINYCYEKTSPTTWLHETLSIDKKRIFDLIMQVAFSKRTILNESVLLESILNSPILR